MSQPRQPTPSQSPTPSKSSLRRTSGVQNPSQRSLIPPPSPHFDDQPPAPLRYSPRSPPNQTLEYESDEDDEPLIYPEPPPPEVTGDDSYLPHPEPEIPFQPFFTLIEDGLTTEHYHPAVHYIFADDDTEIITEAALRSIEQDGLGEISDSEASASNRQSRPGNDTREYNSRLPPATEGVREHYLILDVHPLSQAQMQQQQMRNQQQTQTQSQSQTPAPSPFPHTDFLPPYAVSSFTSFSSTWQISSATITSAPTIGDSPANEDESLMLRIEGGGIPQPSAGDEVFPKTTTGPTGTDDDNSDANRGAREDLETMIDKFQSRLGEIRRLIDVDSSGGGGSGVPVIATETGRESEGDTGIVGPGIGINSSDSYTRHRGESLGLGLEEQD